jgi:hypothetical protein
VTEQYEGDAGLEAPETTDETDLGDGAAMMDGSVRSLSEELAPEAE